MDPKINAFQNFEKGMARKGYGADGRARTDGRRRTDARGRTDADGQTQTAARFFFFPLLPDTHHTEPSTRKIPVGPKNFRLSEKFPPAGKMSVGLKHFRRAEKNPC